MKKEKNILTPKLAEKINELNEELNKLTKLKSD